MSLGSVSHNDAAVAGNASGATAASHGTSDAPAGDVGQDGSHIGQGHLQHGFGGGAMMMPNGNISVLTKYYVFMVVLDALWFVSSSDFLVMSLVTLVVKSVLSYVNNSAMDDVRSLADGWTGANFHAVLRSATAA